MEKINLGGLPIHLWANPNAVEPQAMQQLGNISRLPVVADHIAVMPDVHLGKGGVTVGSVIPTEAAILPSSVGVDIGCFRGDMKVILLDGTQATFEDLEKRTEQFWVYSIDSSGAIVNGLARCVKTRTNASLLRIVISGGDEIICTPDHEFMLNDGSYCQAKDLTFNQSLMPIYRRWQTRDGYESVSNGKSFSVMTHKMVWKSVYGSIPSGHVVHHKNHIHFDNRPENLELMTASQHSKHHRKFGHSFNNGDPVFQRMRRDGIMRRKEDPKKREAMAKVGKENILRYMRERPEHYAESVKNNGKRGSKDLNRFNTSPRQCEICGDIMNNPAALVWHKKKIHGIGKYKCKDCNKKFENPEGVRAHKRISHGYNHKVLLVQHIDDVADVYCLQVEKYHNFALAAGVFVHNCGMIAVQLTLTANDLPDSLAAIRAHIERDVPVGQRMHNANRFNDVLASRLEPGLLSVMEDAPGLLGRRKHKNAWALQIGTLGQGNHFIEINLDEANNVWIMLHSGSRGIGSAIGQHYIAKAKEYAIKNGIHLPDADLAWLPETDPAFHQYWRALSWAQEYAMVNRQAMLDEILHGFRVRRNLPPFKIARAAVNCHHNYVAKERYRDRELYITRKGAIRAMVGDMGIIPGSMGGTSYIVEGLGNEDSFCSCSHGAGRLMSRSEAKIRFTHEDVLEQTAGVECRKDDGIIDELRGAYKDIDEVMAQQKDLVRVVAKLRNVLCVKG